MKFHFLFSIVILAVTVSCVPQQVTTTPTIAESSQDEISPSGFSLASGGLQFVEFYSDIWGTCQAMDPVVHGLEEKYAGKIKFSYLDINNPNTYTYQDFLNVRYQPEFYLLDAEGKVLKKFIGYTSQEMLVACLKSNST